MRGIDFLPASALCCCATAMESCQFTRRFLRSTPIAPLGFQMYVCRNTAAPATCSIACALPGLVAAAASTKKGHRMGWVRVPLLLGGMWCALWLTCRSGLYCIWQCRLSSGVLSPAAAYSCYSDVVDSSLHLSWSSFLICLPACACSGTRCCCCCGEGVSTHTAG